MGAQRRLISALAMVNSPRVYGWEMPNTNNKKRGATVDLILGDKELKKVPQGIDLYTCLEILYLNNNPITKLTGLAMNFRIRFLDMSSCKLTTLVGSDLPKLKYLSVCRRWPVWRLQTIRWLVRRTPTYI